MQALHLSGSAMPASWHGKGEVKASCARTNSVPETANAAARKMAAMTPGSGRARSNLL